MQRQRLGLIETPYWVPLRLIFRFVFIGRGLQPLSTPNWAVKTIYFTDLRLGFLYLNFWFSPQT